MARILILVPYPIFPPRGGGALRCFHLLQELARGHEVHAVVFQPTAELRQPQNGYRFPKTVQIHSPAQTPPPHTLFDRLPGKLGTALHYRWLQRSWHGPANSILLETYHLVRQLVTTNQIDVAIFEHLSSTLTAPLVQRLSPQTIRILDAHNIDHVLLTQQAVDEADQAKPLPKHRKAYAETRWYESHLAQLVHTFFACSDDDREMLETLNANAIKGFTIPNGVDTSRNPFDNRPNKSVCSEVLFCGSLSWPANQDGLLWFYREVWPLILNHQPSLRLVVIGRGAAPGAFSLLQADPAVEFLGEVEDVVPYYRRTGIAVIPLCTGSGTRLKILEAMSLGNPIVSTHIGAQGIDATDGEHLLVANEPTQFAEAVDRLLSHADTFEKVRRAARELVETRYDWRIIGNTMNQAIEDMLRQRESINSSAKPTRTLGDEHSSR